MRKRTRGVRNWAILIAVGALLTLSGLALAQETETDSEDQGPPWLRDGFEGDWTPGTPGPPPWAGQDDDE